ncbi:MAG: TatD family hydrolase [Chloroflexota bacterium]|nr:TatD family hydrolase [Chloroflexota bacterium]
MIDAHAHLTDDRFAADLDEVMDRAASAGITRILTCGEDVASSERALEIARRHPCVRVAVGIHPHRAATWDEAAPARLAELARDARVVAIGETGMDLSGRSAPEEAQRTAFAAQLALAAELGLPVVVHVRDAGDAARQVVDGAPPVRGQVHCYSEGPAEVPLWLARRFMLSFSGTVTYPRARGVAAAARAVRSDRMLLETDAPYLAPQVHRGRRNEPAFVVATLEHVAALRGEAAGRLAEAVEGNAAALFGKRWG